MLADSGGEGGVVHRQWEFTGGFIADLSNVNFLDINSLTAKSVPAGTKNSRPVGFYSRNSTKSTVNPNTTIPQI